MRRALTRLLTGLLAGLAMHAPAADTYTLDPTHTFPSFEVRHHGVSWMRGKFNKSRGSVVLDPEGGASRIEAVIDMTSVDTGLDDLNRMLQGGIFLDAARFPEARFVATDLSWQDGKPVAARGGLTLRGITRPVTLEIRDYACASHFLSRRPLCGADAHVVLNRRDFGITFGGANLIGDEVRLAIAVEGYRE